MLSLFQTWQVCGNWQLFYEKGNSIVPTLKKKGYKHKGWIHVERLNDFYGADFYYKNCRLNRKGEPIYFDKGNSCIIQIASVGFGPCIVIEVFNENAYWFYIKQIKAMGFQQDSSDDGTITYVRRKTAIDCYRARKGGRSVYVAIYDKDKI